MQIIDLSVYLEDNPKAEPFPMSITFAPHTESAKMMAAKLGLQPTDFNDGMALTHEDFSGQFHCGTHVDSPLHFGPIIAGAPAKTIDELPLEWFYQDGVRLDLRHVGKKELITAKHLEDAVNAIGCKPKPLDIVLIWTDYDKLIYTDEYLSTQPGMSREGTEYLLDFGVKVIAVDMYGFDRSFRVQAEEFKKGTQKEMFPAHMVGRNREYTHIEKGANFDKLPGPVGYKIVCFPVKAKGCTAGQTRMVALVE